MFERVFYNSENGKWYRQGDDPQTVRSVSADSNLQAFELLFSRPAQMPVITRTRRPVVD
jgi:hypothetical protein